MPKKNMQQTKTVAVGKPTNKPEQSHEVGETLEPIVAGRWIWVPLKGDWRVLTPEEKVGQQYVLRLHSEYGYELEQPGSADLF